MNALHSNTESKHKDVCDGIGEGNHFIAGFFFFWGCCGCCRGCCVFLRASATIVVVAIRTGCQANSRIKIYIARTAR